MRRGWNTLGWACVFAVCSFCANAQTFSWNWTGFYVGVDAGIISSRSFSSTQATVPVGATPYLVTSPGSVVSSGTPSSNFGGTIAAFNAAAVDTISARGTEVGVHAGYNWQLKPFTVGVEIDYGAFRARAVRDTAFQLCVAKTTGCEAESILSQLHTETNTDWLFTVRPRVGWVYSVFYGYITGGAAFTAIRASTLYTEVAASGAPRLPTGFVATSQSKAGWVIGGGLEVAIAPRWTLRAEYLRVEFSGATGVGQITNGKPFNPLSLSADHKSDIVRVGVSHKFQWWFEEPVPAVAPGPVVVTKD